MSWFRGEVDTAMVRTVGNHQRGDLGRFLSSTITLTTTV